MSSTSGVPAAGLDTESQPPMSIPLQHFVVALIFLVLGGFGGVYSTFVSSRTSELGHVHLFLIGFVCITIMGAMTQFIPVWSDTSLHSSRVSKIALWLVTLGVAGLGASFFAGSLVWVHGFAGFLLLGFWFFIYNMARTLPKGEFDVTERHFALALFFLFLTTLFGYLIALDFTMPVIDYLPFSVTHNSVVDGHATFAVFGIVMTTIIGALYQLATMFTQTEIEGNQVYIQKYEELLYPPGVLLLGFSRMFEIRLGTRLGEVAVASSLGVFGVLVLFKLYESSVDTTPMIRRYGVVALSLVLWTLSSIFSWFFEPSELFGQLPHLLFLGVVVFTVLGTLYHVIPFIIWVHTYSDRLGYEKVPMVDQLYEERIARADFVLIVSGSGMIALNSYLPRTVTVLGGVVATAGFILFTTNMYLIIKHHSPYTFARLFHPINSNQPTEEDKKTENENPTMTGD